MPGALVHSIIFAITVVVASADVDLRERLRTSLTAQRWTVLEAGGGAEALAQIECSQAEALLVDSWLPDLEASELAGQIHKMYPSLELMGIDGAVVERMPPHPRRNELLHVLREAQDSRTDTAAWNRAPVAVPRPVSSSEVLPGLIGASEKMRRMARMIQLVAPRSATVLIEGETGTGKELIARAVHRLSARATQPFVVLNCAAIPEGLLEAELFGHTQGAFTGAVKPRKGRIEAAHNGTLLLDEIGEMPLALQSKILRFLESGELQRVGDNEAVRVNVRVIAATHQRLEQRSREGSFRLDLYYRLAVFPIEAPALRDRMEDLELLAEHFLDRFSEGAGPKRLSPAALREMYGYSWPGNVRELMHALERGSILAADNTEIGVEEIGLRKHQRAELAAEYLI
ncbi:MAG: sigma-54 dependent transcriptional regulator [Acidobacteriaceae bacterium]|nr:sigma-54 dependent transcriptional regulator [Acidobacteriaceae bacterium]